MVCIKALRIFAAKISYKHLIFNIMSECKTVTLRTRPLKKGMLSFYLDYYPGYRDQETMKTIRHEGLNIYIYANPNATSTLPCRKRPKQSGAGGLKPS